MAKKIDAYVKLQVKAGQANPSPPVGPALGQRGVNIMEFCKAFNAQTQGIELGLPIPVVITVYSDRSFTFIMKTPPASDLLKKAAGIIKGSGVPHKDKVGKVSQAQVREIAQKKLSDLNAADLEGGAPADLLHQRRDLADQRVVAHQVRVERVGDGEHELLVHADLAREDEALPVVVGEGQRRLGRERTRRDVGRHRDHGPASYRRPHRPSRVV